MSKCVRKIIIRRKKRNNTPLYLRKPKTPEAEHGVVGEIPESTSTSRTTALWEKALPCAGCGKPDKASDSAGAQENTSNTPDVEIGGGAVELADLAGNGSVKQADNINTI